MDKNIKLVKFVGLAAMLLGGIATLASSWAQDQTMQLTVREEVEKALAERNEEENN